MEDVKSFNTNDEDGRNSSSSFSSSSSSDIFSTVTEENHSSKFLSSSSSSSFSSASIVDEGEAKKFKSFSYCPTLPPSPRDPCALDDLMESKEDLRAFRDSVLLLFQKASLTTSATCTSVSSSSSSSASAGNCSLLRNDLPWQTHWWLKFQPIINIPLSDVIYGPQHLGNIYKRNPQAAGRSGSSSSGSLALKTDKATLDELALRVVKGRIPEALKGDSLQKLAKKRKKEKKEVKGVGGQSPPSLVEGGSSGRGASSSRSIVGGGGDLMRMRSRGSDVGKYDVGDKGVTRVMMPAAPTSATSGSGGRDGNGEGGGSEGSTIMGVLEGSSSGKRKLLNRRPSTSSQVSCVSNCINNATAAGTAVGGGTMITSSITGGVRSGGSRCSSVVSSTVVASSTKKKEEKEKKKEKKKRKTEKGER